MDSARDRDNLACPIVGIGASAGGLEALKAMLGHVPADAGLAFVVVQHMDPNSESRLAALLQKVTVLPVETIADGMYVQPGHIYVIPPSKDLSIFHRRLYLLDRQASHGLRLPIDSFLRSLAQDCGTQAVGVILSGTGSDGTLGLQAIKEEAGLVVAQDPATARFDAMPRSVIDAGLADIVAPPEELVRQIIDVVERNVAIARNGETTEATKRNSALDKIILLLRAHTGQDFSPYKNATLYRRIERRMGLHQIERIADYVTWLRSNPRELDLLFRELLIGVTHFFRDPEAWTALQEQGLKPLLQECQGNRTLRAWVVGCSTGEEAYSLAIAFREVLEHIDTDGRVNLQVFATDLDKAAIEQARRGWYPANIAADVDPERLERYFVEEAGGFRIRDSIREMVLFARHNLIMDPPFTRLDLISCRNLLIYLKHDLQKKLLPLFHYSLNENGLLLLGSAETAVEFSHLFTPLAAEQRLYRALEGPRGFGELQLPALRSRTEITAEKAPVPACASDSSLQAIVEQQLLRHFAPAAVLVNHHGDILYIHGRTGRFLEPAAGRANLNIYAMARDGLREALNAVLARARREQLEIVQRSITLQANGASRIVDLTVRLIPESERPGGLALVAFREAPGPVSAARGDTEGQDDRVLELERALQDAREDARSTREVMQSAQEELRSANEELQSTNEELMTSKEELQSLNEELHTVNGELHSKVLELSEASSDMMNLLEFTDIATVFLDSALKIRRFTTHATDLFQLIPRDAGRPLSDIATALDHPELEATAREVLRTLVFARRLIPTRDGRAFIVKIMPYRTTGNVIDGVVLTFTDISALKQMEAELRARRHSS